MAADPDSRSAQRLDWVGAALCKDNVQLVRASVDAGFRTYWRTQGAVDTWIVMDSPPDLEDVRPWLRVHALLAAGNVRVPRIQAQAAEHGFVLMEDLGGPNLTQILDQDNADAHFDAAIAQLIRLQSIPAPAGIARFDEVLLRRDATLFEEWFIGRHLDLTLDCGEVERWQLVQRRLMDNALSQPQVLTHRDFMPRNLMPVPDGPAVLDFQDMVLGPIAYDPVSLFKDAFLSWPLARVDGWLARYHSRAREAGLPVPEWPQFLRDADWLGVQRHLKILGIFARLHYRDGKPRYLADATRFIGYLEEVLPRHAGLSPLRDLLERKVKPALAARAQAAGLRQAPP